jgi:hypothetical protein
MTKSTTVAAIAARVGNAAEGLDGVWILETGEHCEGGRIVGVYTDRALAADDFLDHIRDLALYTDLDPIESGEDTKRLYVAGGCDWVSLTRYPITTRPRLSSDSSAHDARKYEDLALEDLDDEQRRWLPDPVPADLRVSRCTACHSTAVVLPGMDPWKNHDQECHPAE